MQIRIEIDVKPEELRRFLGLPDIAGLQEDVIQFLREKVGAASDGFDPANFVKENLGSLRKSAAWQKLMSATKVRVVDEKSPGKPPAKRRKAAARKPRRKSAAVASKNASEEPKAAQSITD